MCLASHNLYTLNGNQETRYDGKCFVFVCFSFGNGQIHTYTLQQATVLAILNMCLTSIYEL
jgi:hypothetical protein